MGFDCFSCSRISDDPTTALRNHLLSRWTDDIEGISVLLWLVVPLAKSELNGFSSKPEPPSLRHQHPKVMQDRADLLLPEAIRLSLFLI